MKKNLGNLQGRLLGKKKGKSKNKQTLQTWDKNQRRDKGNEEMDNNTKLKNGSNVRIDS